MMTVDGTYIEHNRAATQRMKDLALRLSDEEMFTRVGEHWTVAVVFAHLGFWDRRVLDVLVKTESAGKLVVPEIDISVNDLSLPQWKAIPPREAARLGIEAAEELDERLEAYPPALLEEVNAFRARWVDRSLHRNGHLDEAEAALKK